MVETTHAEKHDFSSDTGRVMKLMIHSLYSNKEIFLRELISNAADAADKLRFKALSDNALYENDGELYVRISFDKDAKTITISDNGIGMSRDDVIEHLGTIARSGTADFFSQLSGDQAKDSKLIGQFGVGFYSSFIVADKVTVQTRKAGESAEMGVIWESNGESSYTVGDLHKAQRGTDITLHLRDDAVEFLDEWQVRQIVNKYSDHISVPVQMWQPPVEESKDHEGNEIPAKEGFWESINKATALWTLSKSELSDDDYKEFYKHIAHDFEDPLLWSHNRVEGKQEYTSLLYVPARAPYDLWNRDHQRGLKLYVQRVFIMDDAEQFMPQYLRFVKGVLDSNDLPLNVSREILQSNKMTETLRAACTKRVLSMLEKLAKNDAEKYQKFWEQFGVVLKEGPAEDFANKEQIAGLLRFATTYNDSAAQNCGFGDYISRMPEGQDKIYYITADSYAAAAHSPHLEIFRKKGIEVLLMTDRVDEWLLSHLHEFDGKTLVNVTKGDLDLGDLDDEETKAQQEQVESEFSSLVERVTTALGDKVAKVRLSHRLIDTPSCVVTDESGMTSQMIKLMQAVGQSVPEQKYIFELNPNHALVKQMDSEQDEEMFGQWSELLLEQAMLAERGSLNDPAAFIGRVNKLLSR